MLEGAAAFITIDPISTPSTPPIAPRDGRFREKRTAWTPVSQYSSVVGSYKWVLPEFMQRHLPLGGYPACAPTVVLSRQRDDVGRCLYASPRRTNISCGRKRSRASRRDATIWCFSHEPLTYITERHRKRHARPLAVVSATSRAAHAGCTFGETCHISGLRYVCTREIHHDSWRSLYMRLVMKGVVVAVVNGTMQMGSTMRRVRRGKIVRDDEASQSPWSKDG
ncbi:hypothetical protein PHLGIDRAFT_476695 [Phlebiopsis gigantea 11061_1 CR5-6]|uniref:Uncharacterized protein n=1 Tax=Phlebiopsis gigantea (strain 11061_1 CR5-6) TaxID=745531 RepID=A0A0C3SD45_PHLG1|nr:hypothetical protein PHLGIDRAFT_476695 [Phlebiopsis gigantea 11061_1 CR5-6]